VLAKARQCVNSGNKQALAKLLKAIPLTIAEHTIAQLHASIFDHSIDQRHYLFMDAVLDLFPSLSQCIEAYPHNPETNQPSRTLLSPLGVLQTMQALVEKNKIDPKTTWSVADSYADFKDKLDNVMSGVSDSAYFLVRHKDSSLPQLPHIHFSPVYVEKDQSGSISAVMTDCNGAELKDFSFRLAEQILHVFPTAKTYAFKDHRQADKSNCPVFSIGDVIQMQKKQNMVSYAARNQIHVACDSQYPGVKLRIFDKLPGSMIKMTQSIKNMESRKSRLPKIEQLEINRALKKHTVVCAGKPINTLIAKRYLKYERMLMSTAINEARTAQQMDLLSKIK